MKKTLLITLCILFNYTIANSQNNWELLNPKPTTQTGIDIEFVSATVGYIITNYQLLETQDAGATWTLKRSLSRTNDITFNGNIGYIVGDSGFVERSLDGGTTWNTVTTNLTYSFNTVTIIDASTIILSSNYRLVKSIDGGITWQSSVIPNTNVEKTFFTSALVGHVISSANEAKILKTIDGGQNWYNTLSISSYPPRFLAIYFVNENVGFATREDSEMYKTTDGGETWVELTGISDAIYSLYFINENVGYAAGEDGVILKTIDGGATWTWASFQNEDTNFSSIFGIYFEDENIGYATGMRGRIVKTTDGGSTWTPNSLTYIDFRQIQFVNSTTGYANSRGNFYKTIDSGNTWALVGSIPIQGASTSGDFMFIDENIGYAATRSGYGSLYKTINGGVTWIRTNNNSALFNEGINSIFFLDANVGFASAGNNINQIKKTSDGGATWTQVGNISVYGMQFMNSQVGYGHLSNKIYKTVDGGNTWNVNTTVSEVISDMHFIDENNGYFVNRQDSIHKTTDGGQTWEEVPMIYGELYFVKFYSKNVGYVVNEFGRIYKTMNGGQSWDYLTAQNIASIDIINEDIYTAGAFGSIQKGTVDYDPLVLTVNQADNITTTTVTFSGNATSNDGEISNLEFQYSTGPDFGNSITITPSVVLANESLNISVDLTGLNSGTFYRFRLKGTYDSIDYTSELSYFNTLPAYEITTNSIFFNNDYTSTTAPLLGDIVSYGQDVTNIEFQYGINSNELTSSIAGTPSLVAGNSSSSIIGNVENLLPNTEHFYRVKGTHQGEDIYGDIFSFTTKQAYIINLYAPTISGNDVTLAAFVTSNDLDMTNIVMEYGTLAFENSVATNLSQVTANTSEYLYTVVSNLDPNTNYYLRFKGTYNGETIYSENQVFNLSGELIMVPDSTPVLEDNILEFRGLINGPQTSLTNIHFEYGILETYGFTVAGTPNSVYLYGSTLITATINNPLPNETYYYRLVATSGGTTIYSNRYQFTTPTLGIDDVTADELEIYPNPATNFVHISFKNNQRPSAIEFYDITGRLLNSINDFSTDNVLKIDISNFKKGIYLIKVNLENNKTFFRKLIID
jgi:photosystem II stability/assembly factor-like uncharacterized protein